MTRGGSRHVVAQRMKSTTGVAAPAVLPVRQRSNRMGVSSETLVDERNSPIFIAGMPRSGTTLVRSILCAHPRIIISPELNFFSWVRKFGHLDLEQEEQFDRFWREFIRCDQFGHFCVDAEKVRSRIRACEAVSFRTVFRSLLDEFVATVGKPRWGEKTPRNYEHIDVLLEWFPDAQVVFLLRDPRAVSASLLRTPWGGKEVGRHARAWCRSVAVLERWKDDPRVRTVRYEALVAEPESETKELCRFLGEEFVDAMLSRRDANETMLRNREGWAKGALEAAMKPISTASIDKWRSALSGYQVAVIEHVAGGKMREHGYHPAGRPLSFGWCLKWRMATALGLIRRAAHLAARQLLHRVRASGSPLRAPRSSELLG